MNSFIPNFRNRSNELLRSFSSSSSWFASNLFFFIFFFDLLLCFILLQGVKVFKHMRKVAIGLAFEETLPHRLDLIYFDFLFLFGFMWRVSIGNGLSLNWSFSVNDFFLSSSCLLLVWVLLSVIITLWWTGVSIWNVPSSILVRFFFAYLDFPMLIEKLFNQVRVIVIFFNRFFIKL